MNNRLITKIFFCFVIISVVILTITIFLTTPQQFVINNEKVIPFNDGWDIYINDEYMGKQDLPFSFNSNSSNDSVRIEKTLPENYISGMTINFRSIQQLVKVSVEDEMLYQYGYDTKKPFGKSPGSVWNFIRLRQEDMNKTLKIELVCVYNNFGKVINTINYGTKNANVFNIINNNILGLCLSVLVIIIGIILMLCYLFFKKNIESKWLLYLSLFALLAGIWSCMETRMMQFFFADQFITTIMAFLSLMLMPIPFFMFVSAILDIKHKKVMDYMCYAFIANFIVLVTLQIFNIFDFIELIYITHILIAVCVGVLFVYIYIEIVKYKNKNILFLGVATIIFIGISMLDFVQFYNKTPGDSSFFFRFGVLFYIIMLSIFTLRVLLKMMNDNIEVSVLEKLAFVDILTGLSNRTAFEKIINEVKLEQTSIGIFDINDLKYINDNYGHAVGDEIIMLAAKCLKDCFYKTKNIFRIGGDEFCIIENGLAANEWNQIEKKFLKTIEKENMNRDIKISIAYGFAVYDKNLDTSTTSVFIRADDNMYSKKSEIKGKLLRRDKDKA